MLKKTFKTFSLLFVTLFVLTPIFVSAHQPRLTDSRVTAVPNPEISKAYYGKLAGEPDVYTIESSEPFNLYVGILVPDLENPQKDVTAEVRKGTEVIATIGGVSANWKKFFEPFGQSTYWDGGEYKTPVEAGSYSVVVTSINNDSKYSLAIGEIEAFDGKEGMNALNLIPELKREFFEESPSSFIKSPFGWGLIVAMYVLAGIVGLLYRAILKRLAKNSPRGETRNIGKSDRLVRVVIGLGLLLWAITTTWSPILIFFSGFALFEALFSWCGFYAALGKNTCPID